MELISNGDVIAIDVGTTMLEFAQCIENKRHYDFNQFSPVSSVLTELLNQNKFTGQILLREDKLIQSINLYAGVSLNKC